MNTNAPVTGSQIDLTNCDKEPIHIPGRIQPHGVLLVLQEPELTILRISANTQDFFGMAPETLLGQPLATLLEAADVEVLRAAFQNGHMDANPLYIATVTGKPQGQRFDGIAHRSLGLLILELEPQGAGQAEGLNYYALVRNYLPRLQNARTLSALSQAVAEQVRQVSGFDRVMVYQFDEDGHGSVIAEAKREEMASFLHLHYPASDIPKQARRLYEINLLRLIADVRYAPVDIIPNSKPGTGASLDMSYCVLRSVSPIHIEYLQNMNVGASMSVSILQDGKLWGLIACHHNTPRYVPYDARATCEFLGQVVSMQLASKMDSEDQEYRIQTQNVLAQLVELMTQEEDYAQGLYRHHPNLLDFVKAGGAAVCINGKCVRLGQTPEEIFITRLVDWLAETNAEESSALEVFATDHLSGRFREAEIYKEVASGLMAITISRAQRNYLLWFRPEVAQTVQWAGKPEKPIEVGEAGELRLTPRKSFAAWQEAVQNKSLPWTRVELDAVRDLRRALIGVVLRKSEEMARLNIELMQSNMELDSFAYIASHDLKEPLRGIHNYAHFLMEDAGDQLDQENRQKLETLVRLAVRMEDLIDSLLHYSRVGRQELALELCDLNEVVQETLAVLKRRLDENNVEVRIPVPLPHALCDRIQIDEVFTNLISNAIKYNDKPHKWVEIGIVRPKGQEEDSASDGKESSLHLITLYVRDNGIGIREKHLDIVFRIFKRLHGRDEFGGGTGAGLTIARKIVERHGGALWVDSTYGEGTTFYFTLQEPL